MNTAAAKLDTYRSQMAVKRSKCDVAGALSNSDRSISSEVCGGAGSSVGSDRSPPAATLSNHLGYLHVTQSGGQRVRRWEEIKGNGVNWICLSAPTSELQSAGEGKRTSKVFKLALTVECFVHKA